MEFVLYCYISSPSQTEIESFLRSLQVQGVVFSHLGKSDPPRKFHGDIDQALEIIISGTDITNYTFAKDSKSKVDLSFQMRNDPRSTHSTISASCPNLDRLHMIARASQTSFNEFLSAAGILGDGKDQSWQLLHVSELCPEGLRMKFNAAA